MTQIEQLFSDEKETERLLNGVLTLKNVAKNYETYFDENYNPNLMTLLQSFYTRIMYIAKHMLDLIKE